ncbi:hypothetical protein [uncultured Muribaculum sp.]|uniref:hypothetical protein n=1 Tax=uncultured Muribaculum sp. TaxID=1918613 RepID=UPI00258BDB6B|nr:hypothetical protein [uncultured Muribaculum sp.]
MVMTETATPKKCSYRGFRTALAQVKMGDYKEVVAALWKALGICNRNSFYAYRDGKQEPKATQAEAVTAVFERYGITKIWDI